MLLELRVRDLGVIDDQTVLPGPGLTALTGETGAGKTLIVEALGLLVGERPDSLLVRPGAEEAVVEGRFGAAPGEMILTRAVSAAGRSRAYLDGRMASAASLAELGATLLDLHGQHASQSLLAPAAQRSALDAAGGVERGRLDDARRRLRQLAGRQAELGGDARARAHEVDLLRFQLAELDAADLVDPEEDDVLSDEAERLGDAVALRAALAAAYDCLAGDGGAVDRVGSAVAALSGSRPLAALLERLRGVAAEVADGADEVRAATEGVEEDPERLAWVGARRHALRELRRKYGDTLAEVIAYREHARHRLEELESHDATARELQAERAGIEEELGAAQAELGGARRAAAPPFGAAVEARLRQLALPRARFEVHVEGTAGEDVTWLLGANPGEPALPLAKVASGGELARTMLAVRLVLGQAGEPEGAGTERTLVFDEVDAGVGGEAATAVGRALSALADHHQVIVVTHLAQVAAFADHHLVVSKDVEAAPDGERTVARVQAVDGSERVAELSRMLSGRPASATARSHAEELLREARPVRSRKGRGR